MEVKNMKEKWYTLAVSNIGTHKMQFKEFMDYEIAVEMGKDYCNNNNGLTYSGTFHSCAIDGAEIDLRKLIYNEE